MKLPVKVWGERLVDADNKTVAATADSDYWISDFITDAENDAHLAEIAAALNERAALRAQVAELVKAGERILEYGDIYSCKQGEVSPYEQLRIVLTTIRHQAAIAAAEGGKNND